MNRTAMVRAAAACAAVISLYAAPAFAAAASDRARCGRPFDRGLLGDTRIVACTRLIASGIKGNELAIVFSNRASGYYEIRNYDRAITDFKQALRINPRFAIAFDGRALSYREKLDYEHALADINQAIRINPKSPDHIVLRGIIYRDMRDYQRAIADFNAALRIASKSADAFAHRGIAYILVDDRSRALADITRAIELKPTLFTYPSFRGVYHYLVGALDNAIADFSESLRKEPKYNSDALYGRGVAKLAKGDSAGGNADIAAAQMLESGIAHNWMRKFGIGPGAAARRGQSVAGKDMGVSIGDKAEAEPPAGPDCSDAALHWKSAEDVKSLAIYEDHLKRFADCSFAAIARARIEVMKR